MEIKMMDRRGGNGRDDTAGAEMAVN